MGRTRRRQQLLQVDNNKKSITTCWEGSEVPGNSRLAIHKFSPNVCSTAESKQGHIH